MHKLDAGFTWNYKGEYLFSSDEISGIVKNMIFSIVIKDLFIVEENNFEFQLREGFCGWHR